MELLNRYLHAVGARLPDAYREDIVAELRGELLSRIEDREAELHEPLTEREIVTLLKAYGHPLVVAAAYVQGQHLISPALLPFYRFAAQLLIGVDLLSHLIYIVLALLFHEPLGHVLETAANSLWIVTMYLLGVVTFSALILDRIGAGRWLAKAWSPRYLPSTKRRRLGTLILTLDALSVIILGGWMSGLLPVWTWIAWPVAAHVRPIGLWSVSGAVLLAVAVSQLSVHSIERVAPKFAFSCLVAKCVHSCIVLALAVELISARPWLYVTGLDVRVGQAFEHALDTAIAMGVGALGAAAAIALGWNAVSLIRRARRARIGVPAAA